MGILCLCLMLLAIFGELHGHFDYVVESEYCRHSLSSSRYLACSHTVQLQTCTVAVYVRGSELVEFLRCSGIDNNHDKSHNLAPVESIPATAKAFYVDIRYVCVGGEAADGIPEEWAISFRCARPKVFPTKMQVMVEDYLRGRVVYVIEYPIQPWYRHVYKRRNILLTNSPLVNLICLHTNYSAFVEDTRCRVSLDAGGVYTFYDTIEDPAAVKAEILNTTVFDQFQDVPAPKKMEYQVSTQDLFRDRIAVELSAYLVQVTIACELVVDVMPTVSRMANGQKYSKFLNQAEGFQELLDQEAILKYTFTIPWFKVIPGVTYFVKGYMFVIRTNRSSISTLADHNFTTAPSPPEITLMYMKELLKGYHLIINWKTSIKTSYCDNTSAWILNSTKHVIESSVSNCTATHDYSLVRFISENVLPAGSTYEVYVVNQAKEKTTNTSIGDLNTEAPTVSKLNVKLQSTQRGHILLVSWSTLVRPASQVVTFCLENSGAAKSCQKYYGIENGGALANYKWSWRRRQVPPLAPGNYSIEVRAYGVNAAFMFDVVNFSSDIHECLMDAETFFKIDSEDITGLDLIIQDGKEYKMKCDKNQVVSGVNGGKPVWLCKDGKWIHKAYCKDMEISPPIQPADYARIIPWLIVSSCLTSLTVVVSYMLRVAMKARNRKLRRTRRRQKLFQSITNAKSKLNKKSFSHDTSKTLSKEETTLEQH